MPSPISKESKSGQEKPKRSALNAPKEAESTGCKNGSSCHQDPVGTKMAADGMVRTDPIIIAIHSIAYSFLF